jgi:hypothetical protein
MRLLCVRALPEADLAEIARHLADCSECHRLLVSSLREHGLETPSFSLAPEFWLRHEHIDYDQLVELAEKILDESDRELIDAHLETCPACREDVRSLLAFRKEIEPELRVRYGPTAQEPQRGETALWTWWRGLAWKPAYAAAIVLIGIGLVIGIVVLRRSAANLVAQQTPPAQIKNGGISSTPSPENQAARNLPPSPAPTQPVQSPQPTSSPALDVKNREPLKRVENAGVIALLKDGLGTVTVDKAGNVSGLDEIPQKTRQEIGEALLAENIKTPATQTELGGGPIVLRGPDNRPTFKLRSPARTVITLDRPSFEWENLTGATSYRVSVGDVKGHEIAKSEELPADQTRWTPPTSLQRGEIYAWEVEATIDGKKIVSPGRSAPQMKFKILSASSAQELEQLKKARSHLALGVFYAREGMVSEAEREFQILVRENPSSSVLKTLFRQIKSWRQS